jgi:hypothetical protein
MGPTPAADPGSVTLAVIAKDPVPGRVKTRLCPPCTPEQAAAVAEAALLDTLDAALDAARGPCVLVLDGDPARWEGRGPEVIPQRGAGLDERLANAFEDIGGPTVLVGMDTPQAAPALLARAVDLLCEQGTDAVLGRASDGGYWLIGLRRPARDALCGVPMSTDTTHDAQLARLRGLGLAVATIDELCDVDTFDDALAVAAGCRVAGPGPGRFAAAVEEVASRRGQASRH